MNKFSMIKIDDAFSVLKETGSNASAINMIKEALEDNFSKYTFNINIINPDINSELFVMSVYPEITIIDKIITAVMSDNDSNAIKKLWESNKVWTIEIDGRILKDEIITCSNKELTAMLLHEVGHVVYSNSIPTRISVILKYELAKTNMRNKLLIRDKVFRSIMSLPILDACVSDGKRDGSSIKEEIKADTFVKKCGYTKELYSVLTKLSQNNRYPSSSSLNDKMKKVTNFSLQTLDDFQQRKAKLAKASLISLREACVSPYINTVIDEFVETVFEDSKTSSSLINGRKLEYMQERADKVIEDGYFTEFFIFGKKELKRIDPTEIDYIAVRIPGIKNESDKMMLISYIHNKLDMCEYYISILENSKLSRKYKVPHTVNQLYELKKRLLQLRKEALEFKIPIRNTEMLVSWSPGYYG